MNEEKKLKLEIGKRYISRDGKISGKMSFSSTTQPYPFTDTTTGARYTEKGYYYRDYIESPRDLVAEYVEEEQP